MNFIEFESAQKLRGGFYTDPDLASFLIRWVKAGKPKSLLEPSCGDGAFFAAIAEESIPSLKAITGCELDSAEAAKARDRTDLKPTIIQTDFLRWYLFHAQNELRFDAVVGNPPFIRYQYLANEQQLLAEKIFAQLRLPFTKHTNAWVPFVLASIKLLAEGGRLAMVLPSEIFHIPHAQSLRRYLAEECSRILLFDPENIWFTETLQGTVLLLAEKKRKRSERSLGVAAVKIRDREMLSEDPEKYFREADYINGSSVKGKWMQVFLSKSERDLLNGLSEDPSFCRFDDLAKVDVGIVTGANKFFLVPDETVRAFKLDRWAHPMFGRSEHVSGIIYAAGDHEANKAAGLPANFLWFDTDSKDSFPSSVRQYIHDGEKAGLPTRYKCRVRSPWFRVPSVYATRVAMLKRAHNYPRLILNDANAFTTDTAYRIQPKTVDAISLVFSFLNSLTCLSAELEGRHYGGGVLELVPTEIERLLLPRYSATQAQIASLDAQMRSIGRHEEILKTQDDVILASIGTSKRDRETLFNAWSKLKHRRQRMPYSSPSVGSNISNTKAA